MKKLTVKDYKLRLILLNEWKSKTSVKETKRIVNERLGKKSIKTKKVQKWFKRFDKGETSIFDEDSSLNVFVQNRPCDPLNSLLLLSDEKCNDFKLIKCDPRFIKYLYRFEDKNFIVCYDLFLDERKIIIPDVSIWKFKMIGDGFLSAFTLHKLRLYKLNYESSSTNLLDSFDLNEYVNSILVDQLDSKKFVIIMDDERFAMGKVENQKIILDDVKHWDYIEFYYPKRLMNSKFQWFDFDAEPKLLKVHETNLNTMEKSEIDVPIELDDESLRAIHFKSPFNCWTNNRFYGMFPMSDYQFHVLMFDLDLMKCLNIQIVAKYPKDLFVDSNDVLTLKVGEDDEVDVLYRIPLRKPDSLKNLTHLAVLRQSILFEEAKYLNVVKQLSI